MNKEDKGAPERISSNAFTAGRIALLGLLTAFTVVGRLVMQWLPSVQPVTATLIIITLNMGTVDGIIIAALSMLISNIFMGMGPWTIAQIATYALIMAFTGMVMRRFYQPERRSNQIVFALYSGLMGYAYGFIISLMMVAFFQVNHFWAYYLRGLSYDSGHALGNVIFYLLLNPILHPLIQKAMARFSQRKNYKS